MGDFYQYTVYTNYDTVVVCVCVCVCVCVVSFSLSLIDTLDTLAVSHTGILLLTYIVLLYYLNWKSKPRSFPEYVQVQNLGFLSQTYGFLTFYTLT